MKNSYLTISDVLALGPINFEGLDIDTHVEIIVCRDGSEYSIDSSTFGEQPIYVQTAFGHQVRLDKDADLTFKARLEKAIEAKAIDMAKKEDDGSKWEKSDEDDSRDRMDEV